MLTYPDRIFQIQEISGEFYVVPESRILKFQNCGRFGRDYAGYIADRRATMKTRVEPTTLFYYVGTRLTFSQIK